MGNAGGAALPAEYPTVAEIQKGLPLIKQMVRD